MDGGQALVARANRTPPALFEMIETLTEHFSGKVDYVEPINHRLLPGACERQEQSESVAIALLSVPAEVAL